MSGLSELEQRMSVALERVQQGIESLVDASRDQIDPSQLEDLQSELSLQKVTNMSMQHEIETCTETRNRLSSHLGAQSDAMEKMDASIKELRAANAELTQSNMALREIAETDVADAATINESMKAELSALRAERSAERAEVAAVLSAIDTLLNENTRGEAEDA